jgi:hypothetical protein
VIPTTILGTEVLGCPSATETDEDISKAVNKRIFINSLLTHSKKRGMRPLTYLLFSPLLFIFATTSPLALLNSKVNTNGIKAGLKDCGMIGIANTNTSNTAKLARQSQFV